MHVQVYEDREEVVACDNHYSDTGIAVCTYNFLLTCISVIMQSFFQILLIWRLIYQSLYLVVLLLCVWRQKVLLQSN